MLVGRVADIHFDNARYQADVTLALDKRYKFPKDTTASINTSGLLGESYVGLDAGGDDKSLEAGDRISITQSAVVLEKLIGQFLFSKAQDEPAHRERGRRRRPPSCPSRRVAPGRRRNSVGTAPRARGSKPFSPSPHRNPHAAHPRHTPRGLGARWPRSPRKRPTRSSAASARRCSRS